MSRNLVVDSVVFNRKRFFRKLGTALRSAGYEIIEKALWLYYAAQRPETPVWAKATVYSALAYFVLPMDINPDFIPVSGYIDDMGVLLAAVATITQYINDQVKTKTRKQLRKLGFSPD